MRIGLIIADFELTYTTSFQNTARRKYGVDFDTSNVVSIGLKLQELKNKFITRDYQDIRVGFEISLEDVTRAESLLNQILLKYQEVFGEPIANKRIYDVIKRLRDAESPTVRELAREVLNEILVPEQPAGQKRNKRIAAKAEEITKQRNLKLIKKNNAKKDIND